jgi:transposase-like protein
VFMSQRRDAQAARRFFEQALGTTKVNPTEVVTDRAGRHLPIVLDELLPAAWHRTEQYANNHIEADHGRLKAWLRPMRGLKRDHSARVVVAALHSCKTSAAATTSWRLRSQRTREWPWRSTNWPW